MATWLTVHDEQIDASLPYVLFHPVYTWKRVSLPIIRFVRCAYSYSSTANAFTTARMLRTSAKYCIREVDTLWDQIKRFENPQTYFVDLSKKLWSCKNELLEACRI